LKNHVIPTQRSTSSRPKRRTASSSVAQWRDPCISSLPLPFVFAVVGSCRHPDAELAEGEGPRYRLYHPYRSNLSTHPAEQPGPLPLSADPLDPCQPHKPPNPHKPKGIYLA